MIALIPARGGSKGLPRKNIKLLNGKPMIAYTIEAALNSKYITDVVISTDDQEIYDIALSYGAKDTFLRPKELAEDSSLAIDNYIYTIQRLEKEYNYNLDSFIVLQPTSPLRSTEDIDNSICLFTENKADSVISFCEEHHPIKWHKYINKNNKLEDIFDENLLVNRQDIIPTYYPNGAIYIFSKNLILERKYYSKNTYAYIMPRSRSVDIDTIDDFEYVQFLMDKK
ncbi:acylneuraminate cytidylyltransferase family protein [Providencia rettgeri]|uniref:acylneuraminate cytidylyltransferase family protein n=1 Tax=Providencia rettgeri TaxID=587 RepID=UPI0028812F55|nr:acylneuraminate cytidylyltransferase family protein [Providencia rettgeri]ELM3938417.1 acylneuraminate cytidylyltransferase family protein [Providencia rettgeri]EMA4646039.1 acylneuraminate cytidylyltransferase family protein [Providencia rettgeri]MDK3110061.1 acylneuraminate cytidylyltransferase family protein [Providencia rettgeri]WRR97107.1 acylneuraminate cytidylyltransferase family protein [Providencia rettgeri]